MTLRIEKNLRIVAVVSCALFVATTSPAQDAPIAADRAEAIKLCEDHKLIEALPLLEKLSAADPKDRRVREWLAIALATSYLTIPEGKQKESMLRAREILIELKKTGPLSDLGEIYLEKIPPDGTIGKISLRKDVDDAMREGETAFSQRKFEEAFAAYERAFRLDPTFDSAALFAGDTWFARGNMDEACKWFARSAAIDPDHAASFRYWGDALMKAGKPDEAREKYLRGIVADPYSRAPRISLNNWAKFARVTLSHPVVLPPEPAKGESRSMRIEDGTAQLAAYDALRAEWKERLFKEAFPDEDDYRHSLREEYDTLHKLAIAVRAGVKDGSIKALNPLLANLVKLDDEGLLEAYILLARAGSGIAKDYTKYRSEHREKLLEYLGRYVAPKPDK